MNENEELYLKKWVAALSVENEHSRSLHPPTKYAVTLLYSSYNVIYILLGLGSCVYRISVIFPASAREVLTNTSS